VNGAVLQWMKSARPEGLREVVRASKIRVGLSEVFWGERGREVAFVTSAAVLVESLGYDTIWLPEHVVKFETLGSKHPYSGDRATTGWEHQTRGQLDSPITAVAIGMVTHTIRMGTYVNILGQRNPVMFAREIATVDHLSGGRFNLGVGVGWCKEEYEALGVPFERRGKRVDEYIQAMKELWTREPSEFHGEFVDFGPVLAYPKPMQKPHPPILVGGQSKRSIQRAAELGDGLILYNLDPPEIELCLEQLDRALAQRGRKLEDVQVVVGRRNVAGDAFSFGEPFEKQKLREIWEADADFLEACGRLGAITEAVFSPRMPNQDYAELMTEYAATLGLERRQAT
jgi:probable F420-dependent oxidoreductase